MTCGMDRDCQSMHIHPHLCVKANSIDHCHSGAGLTCRTRKYLSSVSLYSAITNVSKIPGLGQIQVEEAVTLLLGGSLGVKHLPPESGGLDV